MLDITQEEEKICMEWVSVLLHYIKLAEFLLPLALLSLCVSLSVLLAGLLRYITDPISCHFHLHAWSLTMSLFLAHSLAYCDFSLLIISSECVSEMAC